MRRSILRETCWALVCAVVCWSAGVWAQESHFQDGFVGEESPLKRHYPFDSSGEVNLCTTSIGCPTLGITFQKAVGATYTPEYGPGYVMTVNGNPTSQLGGTWGPGLTTQRKAWRFDGTGDYLSYPDDPAFEQQDFSVFMCFVPRAGFAVNDTILSKYNPTGNNRQWTINTSNGTTLQLLVSKDGTSAGGSLTQLQKATAVASGRLSCVTVSWDTVANGSSIGNMWVDELSVATTAAGVAPVFNGNSDLIVGAIHGGIQDSPADFYVVAYYPGVLTAADHQRLHRWFRGLYDGALANVVSITAATSPAIMMAPSASGMQPFLVDQPANSTIIGSVATGQGGLYTSIAITNKCWRGSLETWAAGAPTGWTEAVTSTGDCAQTAVNKAHGDSAARCTLADNDDAVTLTSGCATVVGSTAYFLSTYAKLISGTGLLTVNVIEDDSADCGSPTMTTAVINGVVPTSDWTRYQGSITTQAGTIRARVQLSVPAAAAQVVDLDAVLFRAGLATDGYCASDADADAVCSTMIAATASPFSANGAQTVEVTQRTPWAGVDLVGDGNMLFDGPSGSANRLYYNVIPANDKPIFVVTDGASVSKYLAPNTSNWLANTSYTLRAYMDGLGGLGITWPVGTWYTTTAGAGTGIRSAAQALTYIGGSNSAGSDVWTRALRVYRRVMR